MRVPPADRPWESALRALTLGRGLHSEVISNAPASTSVKALATWGQLRTHITIVGLDNHAHLNSQQAVLLTWPGSIQHILERISELQTAAQSLRTTFEWDGSDLYQLCWSSPPCTVFVAHCEIEEAATLASVLEEALSVIAFDAADQPLRVALVVVDAVPRYAVLSISHLAADGASVDIVCAALAADGDTARQLIASVSQSTQPMERAALEQGATGVAQSRRAVDYWTATFAESLDLAPIYSPRYAPQQPRFWQGLLVDQLILDDVFSLGRDFAVSAAAVCLTACVEEFAERLGIAKIPVWLVCSNRTSRNLASSIMNLAQSAPVVVDGSQSIPLRERLRETNRSMLRAYRSAWSDPRYRELLEETVGRFPGIAFNYMPIEEPLTGRRFEWVQKFDGDRTLPYLNVWNGIALLADTAMMSPSDIEAYAHDVANRLRSWRSAPKVRSDPHVEHRKQAL